MAKIQSNYRCVGLESIEIGDVGGTGGILGTTLSTLKNIVADSAFIIFEQPGVTKHYNEDHDYADVVVNTTGARFIEFAIRDMHPNIFELAFGGTTGGTTWYAHYDTALVVKEKSIIAHSKDYGGDKMHFYLTRVAIRGNADLQMSKTKTGMIGFVGEILLPETTTPPIRASIV